MMSFTPLMMLLLPPKLSPHHLAVNFWVRIQTPLPKRLMWSLKPLPKGDVITFFPKNHQ